MKGKKTKGIFADVAVLIICIAIAASCLASGMLAKYVSGAKADGIGAAAASFKVSAKLEKSEYTVHLSDPDDTGKYTLNLSNNSEVAVNYTVILTFDKKVSDFVSAKLDGKEATADESGKVFKWEDAGSIAPNTANAKAQLELIVNGTGYTADQPYDFSVNIIFTQVD